jgi:hypothetical protein
VKFSTNVKFILILSQIKVVATTNFMDDDKEGFRTPRVEACEIGKFLGANVFLNLIAQRIKENLGSMVHECPYEGVNIV